MTKVRQSRRPRAGPHSWELEMPLERSSSKRGQSATRWAWFATAAHRPRRREDKADVQLHTARRRTHLLRGGRRASRWCSYTRDWRTRGPSRTTCPSSPSTSTSFGPTGAGTGGRGWCYGWMRWGSGQGTRRPDGPGAGGPDPGHQGDRTTVRGQHDQRRLQRRDAAVPPVHRVLPQPGSSTSGSIAGRREGASHRGWASGASGQGGQRGWDAMPARSSCTFCPATASS